MKRLSVLAMMFAVLALPPFVHAQDGFFASWENRVRTTSAEQPGWAVPLVTPSSGIVQLFRSDFVRQITPSESTTWNYGNSKGLDIIPWYQTELDVAVPPYIQHNSAAQDGFGDFMMLLKYRIVSADEQHGAYSVSASVAGTIPSGSYKNGSTDATIVPTIYGGKGFGRFDVQSSLSVTLPAADTAKLGRPVGWNVVAQYRIGKMFWPEVESNAMYFHGGPNDGKTQDFVTPGLMVSKIKLSREATNRLAIVFGIGEQIATSHFHTYNHALILTYRIAF
ncbi:MAG TPA: hypothetical protein VKY85_07350 [Candidatus Angelobacter sp.]|nr:hypothetical protein [Candidatus Angelobacter sp.]